MNKNAILKNKIKTIAKTLTLGAALSYGAPAAAHTNTEQDNVNDSVHTTIKELPQTNNIAIKDYEDLGNTDELYHTAKSIKLDINEIEAISPQNALYHPAADYIINLEKWRKSGEVEVRCVDARECITPDLTSVMIMRECATNGPALIKAGKPIQIDRDIPSFMTKDQYIKRLQDPNNIMAAQISDAVNINKSRTRCFICQADVTIAKNVIRYMYCSNNENLRNFASKFIHDTEENRNIAASINQKIFDTQTNDIRIDNNAIADRYQACLAMNKIPVHNLSSNGRLLSNTFIEELKKFDAEHHQELLQAEKDFVIAIYPLANKKNIPALKAQKLAEQKNLRNASCVGLGTMALNTASLIGIGAFSQGTLTGESKTVNNANKLNKANYLSLDAVRQMAIGGYEGAAELYEQSKQIIEQHQEEKQLAQTGLRDYLLGLDLSIETPKIKPLAMADMEKTKFNTISHVKKAQKGR